MKKRISEQFQPYMARPLIYKAIARFLYALLAALLWREFIAKGRADMTLRWPFTFLFAMFLAAAWIAYLRLDGARLPRLPAKRLRRKPPEIRMRDMPDYIDEPVTSFDELSAAEQDVCLLCADLINALIFGLLSLLF